jgi:hypothetical protein
MATVWSFALYPRALHVPHGTRPPRESEAAGGGNHRSRSLVDGMDDLGVVDSTQVRGGDPEICVPELALDNEQWHSLARHLDGMDVP